MEYGDIFSCARNNETIHGNLIIPFGGLVVFDELYRIVRSNWNNLDSHLLNFIDGTAAIFGIGDRSSNFDFAGELSLG